MRTNDAEELGDSKSTAAAVHTAAAPLEATCANTVESQPEARTSRPKMRSGRLHGCTDSKILKGGLTRV